MSGTFASPQAYWGSLVVLVVLTVADWDIQYVLFDLWGERYTLFLNQATAAVYIVMSSLALGALHFQQHRSIVVAATEDGSSTLLETARERRQPAPWYILVSIGLLNGSANFFQAISLPHTPGLTQTILNLLGVPLVLVMGAIFLHRRPSLVASAGAALIVAGTAVSSLRSLIQPDGSSGSSSDPIVAYWWAILFFSVAQLFLAGEKVFEEATFGRYTTLAPLRMFYWTLVTQFLLCARRPKRTCNPCWPHRSRSVTLSFASILAGAGWSIRSRRSYPARTLRSPSCPTSFATARAASLAGRMKCSAATWTSAR